MLGRCENCSSDHSVSPKQAKYRCPACNFTSCSLACVKSHKSKTKCSGVRNRAAAVPRRNFDEGLLMNDYTLLEEVGRASTSSHRATAESQPQPISSSSRSKRAVLAREAAARSVHLHLLPRGFARGKRNTSHTRGRKGIRTMYWHIDVVFVSDGKEKRVNVDACAETLTLEDVIVGAKQALSRSRRRRDPSRNAMFATADICDLNLFILNEHVVGPSSSGPEHVPVATKALGEDNLHRYVRVDPKQTLGDVLTNRIIIEFPILYVSLADSKDSAYLLQAKAGVFEKPEPESDSDSSASESDSLPSLPSDSDGEIEELADNVEPAPSAHKSVSNAQQASAIEIMARGVPINSDEGDRPNLQEQAPDLSATHRDAFDSHSLGRVRSKRKREAGCGEWERSTAEDGEIFSLPVDSALNEKCNSHVPLRKVKYGPSPVGVYDNKGKDRNAVPVSNLQPPDTSSEGPQKRVCLPSSHGAGIPLAESSSRIQDDDPPIPRLARVSASFA